MTWKNSTRKRYESLGYAFTNYEDTFDIKIENLPKRSSTIVTAICETCEKEKEMPYGNYNQITNNGTKEYKCRECFLEETVLKYSTIKNEVENAGYKLITKENEFKNGQTRIKYICPKHGEHDMKAANFHSGKRCPGCQSDKARERYSFSQDEVYAKVKSLGGELMNKEDYINQDIKNLKILCPCCHENIFTTSLKHFCQHGGQSCPNCCRKESVGERKIRQWLEDNNFEFIKEKWFPDCRDVKPLPFDFYLPNENKVIEFDGKQHFEETHFFSHTNSKYANSITSYTQYHDSIKTNYCLSHNISLIRIPYTEINNIEKILQKELIA